MKDDVAQLLQSLRLKKMAELVDAEVAARREGAAARTRNSSPACCGRSGRRIRKTRSPGASSGRDCPSSGRSRASPSNASPASTRKQIRTFAELEFIPRAENIVFVGPTGVGKTGLASGLLLKALQNGHRGIFMRAQDLFDEMYASLADRSTRRFLNRLARVDVLLIDEMGYLNLRPEQTNIFFKLMEERYRQRPTIITTNLDYAEWANFLGNKAPRRRAAQPPAPPLPHGEDRRPVTPRTERLSQVVHDAPSPSLRSSTVIAGSRAFRLPLRPYVHRSPPQS